jgi:hypothetical protein
MGNELDTTAMTMNLEKEKELEMVNFFRNTSTAICTLISTNAKTAY